MTEVNLSALLGPTYDLNITDPVQPLQIGVGSGGGGGSSSATLDVAIVAAATINAYRAVGYDGLHTSPTAESLAIYAGVSRVASNLGDPLTVVRMGLITEIGWTWVPDQPIFITTDGVLTQTPPTGAIRRIGWTLSPTKVSFDPFPTIDGV